MIETKYKPPKRLVCSDKHQDLAVGGSSTIRRYSNEICFCFECSTEFFINKN